MCTKEIIGKGLSDEKENERKKNFIQKMLVIIKTTFLEALANQTTMKELHPRH
jgi:hypothetical protein